MIAEALTILVPHLAELPLAVLLVVRVAGFPNELAWTTSGHAHARARSERRVPWAPKEYEALALAVELGRAGHEELVAWSARKAREPAFRVDAVLAMLQGAAGLVPYLEVYEERRVGRGGGAGAWRMQRALAKDGTPLEVPREDSSVQRRSTLTFGALLERVGAELVDVQLGPFRKTSAASDVDLGPMGGVEATAT